MNEKKQVNCIVIIIIIHRCLIAHS
uniref:Uncharacterized protein n=1 Tax=Anguilla anguilla TaxID=7936 RepID=A0A0E9QTY9_ANGAN